MESDNTMSAPAAEHPVTIRLADIVLRFWFDDRDFVPLVRNRYEGFLSDDEPQVTFWINLTHDYYEKTYTQPRVIASNDEVRITRHDFEGLYDPSKKEGRVQMRCTLFSLDSFFRIFFSHYLMGNGGLLLHACGLLRKDLAYIFTGVSESGKTTVSRLSDENTLLSDEILVIRLVGEDALVYGTPFWGDFEKGGVNVGKKIEKLFFLHKALENSTNRVPTGHSLKRIMRNVLFFSADPASNQQVFEIASDIFSRVPAFDLHFLPDNSIWRYVENA